MTDPAPRPRGRGAGERLLNVIDLEATCWAGPPPPGQVSDIIEIGICVLDLVTGQRVERGRIMVRPSRSEVSTFCTELTGITADELRSAGSFAQACHALREDFDSLDRPWASWGDYDRHQVLRQCAAELVEYPFGPYHVNAKATYAAAHGLPRKRSGMATALEHAGLPLEGRHHRGDDDAWNIAALIATLIRSGHWPSRPDDVH